VCGPSSHHGSRLTYYQWREDGRERLGGIYAKVEPIWNDGPHTHTMSSLIEKNNTKTRYPRGLKKVMSIHKIHEIEYNF